MGGGNEQREDLRVWPGELVQGDLGKEEWVSASTGTGRDMVWPIRPSDCFLSEVVAQSSA